MARGGFVIPAPRIDYKPVLSRAEVSRQNSGDLLKLNVGVLFPRACA